MASLVLVGSRVSIVDPVSNQSGGFGPWEHPSLVGMKPLLLQTDWRPEGRRKNAQSVVNAGRVGVRVQARNLTIRMTMGSLMIHLPDPSVRAGYTNMQGHWQKTPDAVPTITPHAVRRN